MLGIEPLFYSKTPLGDPESGTEPSYLTDHKAQNSLIDANTSSKTSSRLPTTISPTADLAALQLEEEINFMLHASNPFAVYCRPDADIWKLYLRETEVEDKELVASLQVGLDQLLIFAGLFGAILTAFVVETRQDLKPDPAENILQVLQNGTQTKSPFSFQPPQSALIVNGIWFASLILTLTSALCAVLAKEWLSTYVTVTPKERSQDACERHVRALRAEQWGLKTIVAAIPLTIQISLLLFILGLIFLARDDNWAIGWIVLVLPLIPITLYFVLTFLPWFSPACPFRTTLSRFVPKVSKSGIRTSQPAGNGKKGGEGARQSFWIQSVKKFWEDTQRVYEQVEIEGMILAWVITSSSKDTTIQAAIKALAGMKPSRQLQENLSAANVYDTLRKRLDRFNNALDPLATDDDAEACLLAIAQCIRRYDGVPPKPDLKGLGDIGALKYALGAHLHPLLWAVEVGVSLHTGSYHGAAEGHEMATTVSKVHVRQLVTNTALDAMQWGNGMNSKVKRLGLAYLVGVCHIGECRTLINKRSCFKGGALDGLFEEDASVKVQTLDLIEKLGSYDGFVELGTAFPAITSVLGDDEWNNVEKVVDILNKLSENNAFNSAVSGSIPTLVTLLDNYAPDSVTNILTKLSLNDAFKDPMGDAILKIVSMLKDGGQSGRNAAVNFLSGLADSDEHRSLVNHSIPTIVSMLEDDGSDVQSSAVDALSKLAGNEAFRSAMDRAIRNIASMIKHNELSSREGLVKALGKLSENGLPKDVTREVFPTIVSMLGDNDPWTQASAVETLSKLANDDALRIAVNDAIPAIILMLKDDFPVVRTNAVYALGRLYENDSFKGAINDVIPTIASMIKDNASDVRASAVRVLSKLAGNDARMDLVHDAVPSVLSMLKDNDYDVRTGAIDALGRLSGNRAFKDVVIGAIPDIIPLFKDGDFDVRASAVNTLGQLAQNVNFQDALTGAISITFDIIRGINPTRDNATIKTIADAFGILSANGSWMEKISTTLVKETTVFPSKGLRNDHHWSELLLFKPFANTMADNVPSNAALGHYERSRLIYLQRIYMCATTYYSLIVNHATIHISLDQSKHINAAYTMVNLFKHHELQMLNTQMVRLFVHGLPIYSAERKSQVLEMIAHIFESVKAQKMGESHKRSAPQGAVYDVISTITSMLKNVSSDVRESAVDVLRRLSEDGACRSAIHDDMPEIVSMLDTGISGSRQDVVKVLNILSKSDEFKVEIGNGISTLVSMLKDGDYNVRDGVVGILQNLSNHDACKSVVNDAIPDIALIIKDANFDIQASAVDALNKLSNGDVFKGMVSDAAPVIGLMLKNASPNIRASAVDVLSKLSAYDDAFKDVANDAIPELVEMLKDNDSGTRESVVDAFGRLSKIGVFESAVIGAIPAIVSTLRDVSDYPDIQDSVVDAVGVLYEIDAYKNTVDDLISTIMYMLKDDEWTTRKSAIALLGKLSDNGAMERIIPEIVSALEDGDPNIRSSVVDTLSKLANNGALRGAISDAIPNIASMLKHHESDIQASAVDALSRLFENDIFKGMVYDVLSTVVPILENGPSHVRTSVVNALSKLSEDAACRNLVHGAIPAILSVLKDEDWLSRQAAVSMLNKLFKDDAFKSAVVEAIPCVALMLKDPDLDVRASVVHTLSELSEKRAFQNAISSVTQDIVLMLKDYADETGARASVAQVLTKLSENDELRSVVSSAIPDLVLMLKDTDFDTRGSAIQTLKTLSENDSFKSVVNHAIPDVVSMLKDDDSDNRQSAADVLCGLSERALLCHPLVLDWSTLFDSPSTFDWNQTRPAFLFLTKDPQIHFNLSQALAQRFLNAGPSSASILQAMSTVHEHGYFLKSRPCDPQAIITRQIPAALLRFVESPVDAETAQCAANLLASLRHGGFCQNLMPGLFFSILEKLRFPDGHPPGVAVLMLSEVLGFERLWPAFREMNSVYCFLMSVLPNATSDDRRRVIFDMYKLGLLRHL